MQKTVELMIFDFDGTLADTKDDLVVAVNHTLSYFKLSPRTEEDIVSFVGDGVTQLIERSLGISRDRYISEAMNVFTDYYGEHLVDRTKLCPGVEDVLRHYAHKKKVIVTNKRTRFAKTIAAHLGIEQCFLEIIGADTTPYQKPDVRIMDYVLNRHGAPREKTVIIGDGKNDIALAASTGIFCCACLNGLGKREDLLAMNADVYCENIIEIKSFFC
ncbi:MAG: HAD-IA family hydrolase [Smithellaceae bacterium]